MKFKSSLITLIEEKRINQLNWGGKRLHEHNFFK